LVAKYHFIMFLLYRLYDGKLLLAALLREGEAVDIPDSNVALLLYNIIIDAPHAVTYI
jgi:hypothetical protein